MFYKSLCSCSTFMVADALYVVDRCTRRMTERNSSNPDDSWVVVEFEETLRTEMVERTKSKVA